MFQYQWSKKFFFSFWLDQLHFTVPSLTCNGTPHICDPLSSKCFYLRSYWHLVYHSSTSHSLSSVSLLLILTFGPSRFAFRLKVRCIWILPKEKESLLAHIDFVNASKNAAWVYPLKVRHSLYSLWKEAQKRKVKRSDIRKDRKDRIFPVRLMSTRQSLLWRRDSHSAHSSVLKLLILSNRWICE